MFFFLSKVLAFLLAPFTWLFIALLVLLKKTWHSPFKKWVLGFVICLYVCSNSFIVDEITRAWEYEDDDIYLKSTKYDLAILLSGMGRVDERQDRFDFTASGDRLLQTMDLYYKGRIKKILVTGGSGSISKPHQREAAYIKRYLLTMGVPDSCVMIENNSRNTYENAIYTKHLLDSLHYQGNTLLVTSSFHMRRSKAIFEKAGYQNITPYVTNKFSGLRKFEFDHLFIPNVEALWTLQVIVHEIVGYLIYDLRGYL